MQWEEGNPKWQQVTSWLLGSSHAVPPPSDPSGLSPGTGQLQGQFCGMKTLLAAGDPLKIQADRYLPTSNVVMGGRGRMELKNLVASEPDFLC